MVFYLGKYVYNWSTAANTCKIWKVRTLAPARVPTGAPLPGARSKGITSITRIYIITRTYVTYPDLQSYPVSHYLPGFVC